jgi:hypothetical protein
MSGRQINSLLLILAMVLLANLLWISGAEAAISFQSNQITTTFLNPTLVGTNAAILRTPPPNPNAHIGIFLMHSFASYVNFTACTALAQRGYTTLCADTVFTNRHHEYKGFEDHAPAITAGIAYLRNKVPGITKVILFGHSMGAPMMAFYDNIQENGVAACLAPARIIGCDATNLADSSGKSKLLPVDGVILFDAHLGDAFATFTYVDPAIKNPNKPELRNQLVDMFDPRNGYPNDSNAGSPNFRSAEYSDEFIQRFLQAQANRNADILLEVQRLWADIQAGNKGSYHDDMPFIVPGSEGAARLWQADLSLLKCTKDPHIVLAHDGIQNPSPGPVCSVRPPSASAAGDQSIDSVIRSTVRIWLGAHALRTNGPYRQTANDITGIDYDSSNTNTVTAVKGISKPFLLVSNSGHYFVVPDEIIFNNVKSTDKTYAIEEGSVHGGGECTACEKALGLPIGYFGDTNGRTYDFMDQWLSKRF